MKIKNSLFVICCVLCSFDFESNATNVKESLWPICDAEKGSGIIGKPQQYIGNEQLLDELFISAPEGTTVVSPADGKLSFFSICCYESLQYSISFNEPGRTFDEMYELAIKEEEQTVVPAKYYSGSITLILADGRHLHISGIRGSQVFKTGMTISAGDTLGTVSYAYKAFEEPHIELSLSTRDGKIDDVMSFLGLESTFVSADYKRPEHFSRSEAEEDLDVLLKSYKECYPSLDEIVTEEQFYAFRDSSLNLIGDGITYDDFYMIVRSSTSARLAHDSHISVLDENPLRSKINYHPHLLLEILNGEVFVARAPRELEHLIGKKVSALDGEPASDVIDRVGKYMTLYDLENKSYRDMVALTASNYIYKFDYSKPRTSKIEFTDGTSYIDEWSRYSVGYVPVAGENTAYVRNLKRNYFNNYTFERLNDSTAFFSLATFELNRVELDAIRDSIIAISGVPNLIVDLRNNPGGSIEVINELLSYFLTEPSVPLNSYKKVNSNTTYESFKYSNNHSKDEIMFGDYVPMKDKAGYYLFPESPAIIMPDSLVNYPGRLYLLTDETSVSAATDFPAKIVRNHRGVTVGRETGSAYHFITADKFVDIILPNSRIQVRIPLIKEVFEDLVTERTPAGRGLMPDYEVPLTYEELYTSPDDFILNKALELIRDGEYLGDNPFPTEEPLHKPNLKVGWLILGILAILSISFGILLFRKRLLSN